MAAETIEEIIKNIRQIMLDSDEEYKECKDDFSKSDKRIAIEERYYSEIEETIDNTYKSICNNIPPTMQVPEGLDMVVAKMIRKDVEDNGVSVISNTTSTEKNIMKALNLPSRFDEERENPKPADTLRQDMMYGEASIEENIKDTSLSERFHGIDDSKYRTIPIDDATREEYKELGEINEIIEKADGTKIIFIDSIDENYKIPDGEDDEVEKEITLKEIDIQDLDNDVKNDLNPNLEFKVQEYKKFLNGLGIDAALRHTADKLIGHGAIFVLSEDNSYNEYRRQTLYELLDAISPENAQQNDYQEDSYTMMAKSVIYSRILNDPMMKIDGKIQQELREKMQKADSKLYSLVEKNPQFLETLQTVIGERHYLSALIKCMGNTPVDKEAFLENMESFCELNQGIEIDNSVTNGYDDYEEGYKAFLEDWKYREESFKSKEERDQRKAKNILTTRKRKIPFNVIVRSKTNTIQRLIDKKGVGIAISSIFLPENIAKDKGQSIYALKNIFDFDKIGEKGNYVDKIEAKDIELMRACVQKLIDNQNDKSQPYIVALGKIVKKASEREKGKIFSADKVDVKDIVEQFYDGTDSISRNSQDNTSNEKDKSTDDDGAR